MTLTHLPSRLTSTFAANDVTILLEGGEVELVDIARKEALIRAGRSYGTLLTPETAPSEIQITAYKQALVRSGARIGGLLTALSARLLEHPNVVYISLARAGLPVGCVLRRLARHAGRRAPHYGVSIIRGVGLDGAALAFIRRTHPQAHLIFIDGWSGKGAVAQTLTDSLPADLAWSLAMLSDPAGVSDITATYDDLLLPHAALNATVSGLLSRTFLRGQGGFHGARLESELAGCDVSQEYVDALEALALAAQEDGVELPRLADRPVSPARQVLELAQSLGVSDPNLVKPSVGEATRVFLRRCPTQLLLRDFEHPDTVHLRELAAQQHIPVSVHPALPYLAAAIIAPGASTG
ncbi:hypothetical protein EHF33_14730 [Deinococcus psychrotolerans]|uniref:Uncharacterized protein n=1 Tax=Deinococcus psychrotolerans TaxID=2489213 RepID=A0A3G8YGT5_9DEIO|nr:cysteine protease StiP domain-containing protein [Deinococcus psychrotolerans]AZI44155.1 hypothetical protein EHF33_14730 [Deinococcus psychrotolerans]